MYKTCNCLRSLPAGVHINKIILHIWNNYNYFVYADIQSARIVLKCFAGRPFLSRMILLKA